METPKNILTDEQYALFRGLVIACYDNLVDTKLSRDQAHLCLGSLLASLHRYWNLSCGGQVQEELVTLAKNVIEWHVLEKTMRR